MKRIWLPIVALAGLLGSAAAAPPELSPQDLKPVAVISIAGYDAVLKTIADIGAVAGSPGREQALDAMVKGATGGEGLPGVDPKRPWGVAVMTDGARASPSSPSSP